MAREKITVLLGDPRLPDRTKPGGRYTPDDLDQIVRLKSALAELERYEFDYWDDHERLLDDLRRSPPTLALNFCDTGFRNEQRHELHVAALLEMLGIAYSGSGPVALAICYDKALVRAAAGDLGVPVPHETFIRAGDPLPELTYPAFIKPNRGDGSLGITTRSLVRDAHAARECVDSLRRELADQDLVAQEFLEGDEYGMGIIGNPGQDVHVLPMLEVDYDALAPSLPRLLDYGSKTDPDSPYWKDVKFRPARIDDATRERIAEWCLALFPRLGLRDYARFDFRTDAGGAIKLMEVNPNPAWCWDGKLAHMAALEGRSHGALLGLIIEAARARYGLTGA